MAVDKESMLSSHHTKLQKIVLRWDYLQLLASQTTEKKRQKDAEKSLKAVPETFLNIQQYMSVFEPLLLEECKAQIVRGDDEGGVAAQSHMVALSHCEKVNEFHSAKVAISAEIADQFTDNDLVLLTKEALGGATLPTTYAFAVIEGREGQQILRLRLYIDEADAKTNKAAANMRAALQIAKSAWWICKMCNLSTISREYIALCSLDSLPFKDVILSAKSKVQDKSSDSYRSVSQSLMEYLKSTHNQSQIEAIQSALSPRPLVLIQGPPGTGKTQTILGLLSVVLHSTPSILNFENGSAAVHQRSEMPFESKLENWLFASPWLGASGNPRDMVMPFDGDDGFFPTAPNQYRPEEIGIKRKHRTHVLVCAPSNSALDEIVIRLLKTGLHDENGEVYIPSIVRVGLNAHHSVQNVAMDNLVNQRLKSIDRSAISAGSRGGSGGAERDRVRMVLLEEAAIVCSTLAFSGSNMFARMRRGFDVVVIDEAAQAVEPSTLVPLVHGCKQVFLVGDPKQLPATVLSKKAVKNGYATSMFNRFQKAGYPVEMLKTQYRMHPEIREFPSKEFYDEALEDGDDVEAQTRRDWHEYRCFGPFAFFDVEGEESQPRGSGSIVNTDEVEFVLVLYRHMIALYPQLKGGRHFAIISPYKEQVDTLRSRFVELLGKDQARLIDVNTVDGFQGREKDIAIFSCVRSSRVKMGFISDNRRMNVGLTRARASMLVVGCAASLKQNKHWSNLIASAVERGTYFKVTKPYHTLFNERTLSMMKKIEKLKRVQEMRIETRSMTSQQEIAPATVDDGVDDVENQEQVADEDIMDDDNFDEED